MSKRGYIPLKEKLAAALRVLGDIPWEHARQMTADQIISLFQADHYPIRKEMDGPDVHWNLQWLMIKSHRTKTGKIDRPAIAKSKRLIPAEAAHRRSMQVGERLDERAEAAVPSKPRARIPSRPFPKGQRKLSGGRRWQKRAT